jgi:PAS domain S-box-containing protein
LERLFSSIPAAIFVKNAEMEYTAANTAYLDLLGVEVDELEGKTDHDIFPWDLAEQYRLEDMEVLIKARAKLLPDRKFTDGAVRWVSFTAYPLFDDESEVSGLVGFGVDITRRKRLEKRTAAITGCMLGFVPDAEENLRRLLGLCGDVFSGQHAFFFTQPRASGGSRVVSWRDMPPDPPLLEELLPPYAKVWELEDHEVECFSPYSPPVAHPVADAAVTLLGKKVRLGERSVGVIVLLLSRPYTPDGGDIEFLEIVASAVAAEEQRRVTDIRLREALQQASEANRAKSDFLARVTHELKTPLNGILGRLQLLLRGSDLPEVYRRDLRIIGRHGTDLLGLINDLLDIARIERGEFRVRRGPFSLDELLGELEDHFHPLAAEKGLRFGVVPPESPPPTIEGDRKIVKHILVNLLGNGVKYTSEGSVCLKVRRKGERYRFSVHDTGRGIPSERFEEIFRPFGRIEDPDRTDEAVPRGTGLGLHIVFTLVRLLGSVIRVRSRPDRGSIFWFTLHLPPAEEGRTDTAAAYGAPLGSPEEPKIAPERPRADELPPRALLESLYAAARIGDIGRVKATLESEAESHGRYPAFAAYIGELVRRFSLEKLTTFLVECLREND